MNNIIKICALMTLISFNGVGMIKNTGEISVRKVRFDLTPTEVIEHSGSIRFLSFDYVYTHPSVITRQVSGWFKSNKFSWLKCGLSFSDNIHDNLQKVNRLSYKRNLFYLREEDGRVSVFLNANDPNSFSRFAAYINNVINPYPDMKDTAEEDSKIMQELTGIADTKGAANEFKKKVLSTTIKIYGMRV